MSELMILGEALPYISKSTGKAYPRLRVICYCGKEFIAHKSSINAGDTKSCGCSRWNHTHERMKHGLSNHPLHKVWCGMNNRCYNPESWCYNRYGGRGITVCSEWRHDLPVFYLWAMNTGYRKGLQLDRIDNDNGYSPENCRWISHKENMRNTERSTIITYKGKTKHLKEWCELLDLTYGVAYSRIVTRKLPPEIAFNIKKQLKSDYMDKEIYETVKNLLKSEGRTQRWLMSKLTDKGINTNDSRLSNQLNGIIGFDQQEIEYIDEILGTSFNIIKGTE